MIFTYPETVSTVQVAKELSSSESGTCKTACNTWSAVIDTTSTTSISGWSVTTWSDPMSVLERMVCDDDWLWRQMKLMQGVSMAKDSDWFRNNYQRVRKFNQISFRAVRMQEQQRLKASRTSPAIRRIPVRRPRGAALRRFMTGTPRRNH